MVKNECSMLKISYTGCPGLSLAISAQFTLEMCAATENCKKKH